MKLFSPLSHITRPNLIRRSLVSATRTIAVAALFVGLALHAVWAQAPPGLLGPRGTVGLPGAAGFPSQRPEQSGEQTLAVDEYRPKGVPLGSFRLFPVIEVGEVYNDNIYATASGMPGKLASFVQTVQPSVDIRSDWNNHLLNFYANANVAFYTASAQENYQDFNVGTSGRLDIQRDWNVYGNASFNRGHEERGTPNNSTASLEPNKFNQIPLSLGYYQKVDNFSVRLDGRLDNFSYLNPGPGPSSGVIFNYDRNRNEWLESLRLGYELAPAVTAWARGALNQRQYQNTPDTLGFYRNNWGYNVVVGLSVDLGGVTAFEAFVGYLQQYYTDSRFPSIGVPTFGLTGYWTPIRELRIKPYISRTVEDAVLLTAAAYLSTTVGLEVDYQLRPNIRLSARGNYLWAQFIQITGTQPEQDNYLTLRAGLAYDLSRNHFVGLSYQWISKASNLAGSDFSQSLVMLRLGGRF